MGEGKGVAEGGSMNRELMEDIEQSCKTIAELETKTNEELAQLLVEHVWSYLDVFTATSDLISTVIDRLRGRVDTYDIADEAAP